MRGCCNGRAGAEGEATESYTQGVGARVLSPCHRRCPQPAASGRGSRSSRPCPCRSCSPHSAHLAAGREGGVLGTGQRRGRRAERRARASVSTTAQAVPQCRAATSATTRWAAGGSWAAVHAGRPWLAGAVVRVAAVARPALCTRGRTHADLLLGPLAALGHRVLVLALGPLARDPPLALGQLLAAPAGALALGQEDVVSRLHHGLCVRSHLQGHAGARHIVVGIPGARVGGVRNDDVDARLWSPVRGCGPRLRGAWQVPPRAGDGWCADVRACMSDNILPDLVRRPRPHQHRRDEEAEHARERESN